MGEREGLHLDEDAPPPQMDADLGGAPSREVLAGSGVVSGSSGRSKASTRGMGGCETAVGVGRTITSDGCIETDHRLFCLDQVFESEKI